MRRWTVLALFKSLISSFIVTCMTFFLHLFLCLHSKSSFFLFFFCCFSVKNVSVHLFIVTEYCKTGNFHATFIFALANASANLTTCEIIPVYHKRHGFRFWNSPDLIIASTTTSQPCDLCKY